MPGARCARSRVCSVESTRVSHHGHTGNTRHSPRKGFTAYLVLSPVIGLLTPSLAKLLRQLDASAEASGPHDFAVRIKRHSSRALSTSTASRLASVTIASRPSVRRDGGGYRSDLGERRREIFLQTGLDWWNHVDLLQQIRFFKTSVLGPDEAALSAPTGRANARPRAPAMSAS